MSFHLYQLNGIFISYSLYIKWKYSREIISIILQLMMQRSNLMRRKSAKISKVLCKMLVLTYRVAIWIDFLFR